MTKPPLFRQRGGESVLMAGRPGRWPSPKPILESLEHRLLLAANSTAANVFAQFEGNIASAGSTVTIPLNFTTSNFTFSGKKSVLGVQVIAEGGTLDPAVVQIKDLHNRSVAAIFKNANLASRKQSLALANFSAGKYKLIVSSEHSTIGAFTVNLFVAGDANGDHQVNSSDAKTIKKNLGKRTGQSGYSVSADSNLNGTIDGFDLAQATANNKDRTSLRVLALSAGPTGTAGIMPDGSSITRNPSTSITGLTFFRNIVALDTDGDGFDDGSIKSTGAPYSLPTTLLEGLNTIRVRATDSFGQERIVTVRVTLDSIAPTIFNLALASGFQLPGAPARTTTARTVSITGITDPGSTLLIMPAHALAAADGSFSMPDVQLAMGANALSITVLDPAGNSSVIPLNITRVNPSGDAQIVLDWDAALLAAIQTNASTTPEASRQMAIVHAAIYDALNAIDRSASFLYTTSPAAAGASPQAAVAAAAHTTMSYLFPAQSATFDALLADSLSSIPAGQSKTDGLALGEFVANIMIALRQNDGSSTYVPYTPITTPGRWQPSPTDSSTALLPNWATLAPFAMHASDTFRPGPPPALDSAQFATDLAETLALGKNTSATRTADQTAIANFWADGVGTLTPAGHWNQIAAQVAEARNSSLFETARMFAMLDIAMADASIASWDAKYAYDFWRPISAAADSDPTWLPLQNTPASPEYLPEQSTISGAAQRVLSLLFGFDVPFTATAPGSAPRHFTRFDDAAKEAASSGVLAGIDFHSSTQSGLDVGNNIAEWTLNLFSEFHTSLPAIQLRTRPGAFQTNPTITGHVNSYLWSIKSLQASVDGKTPTTIPIDEQGNFSFTPSLPLNGAADKAHTIFFALTDSTGQLSTTTFTFTLDTKAPTLTLTSPASGALTATSRITGTASGTGSALTGISYAFDSGLAIHVGFNASGAFDAPLDLSRLAPGSHTLRLVATDAAGNVMFSNKTLTLSAAIPLTITSTSPTSGAIDIGATAHPRITFSRAIDSTALNSNNFFATALGQKLPTTIVPSADGTSASLFLTDPLPGATLIQVTVDALGITNTFSFTTASLTNVPNTTLHGTLADLGPDQTPNTPDDQPLAGATISILGQNDSSAIAAADGSFHFDAIPAGDVKLIVESQVFNLHVNAATDNSTTLYLPRTAVLGDASSAPHLTTEQRSHLSIDIPANSLLQPDGSKLASTQVTLTTLPPQFAMTLQGELQHAFLINVQTPGAVAFDQPASLTFPNIFSAAPGARLNVISFDPATGLPQISATATVSPNGLFVFTDPNQGITHPGIHGLAPPGSTIFATGAPLAPNDYVTIQIGNSIPLRTRTDNAGHFSLFVPPDKNYSLTIFDPSTGKISHSTGTTPHSGEATNVPQNLVFNTTTQIDSDADGLNDDIEFAIATNPAKKDSDGDGLTDFAAILNHLDPNQGRAYPTGIVASLPMSGQANDITIDSASHLAYVATGSAGLAIVDVAQFDKPILLGQLDLPGDAVSIGIDPRLNIAAIASGPAGLHLINVADPAHPILLQTIGTDARALAIVDGVAYVATGAGLESYDVLTGEQLQSLPLAGGAVALAVDGSFIYTMDSTNRLRAIDIGRPAMAARGSLLTPEGGGKLFVANGIAYIAAASSVNGGFATVDVSNPDSLQLLSKSDIADGVGAPASALAANGSGLMLEVGQINFAFGGATVLEIFNSSDPTNTADMVSQFILPGETNGLRIAAGIAYIASGSAGLQIVNYLPFDTHAAAPTATLASPSLDVTEGSTIHLTAQINDDMQLRSVELLVNGQVISTHTAFPFDLRIDLPKISSGTSTATAQVRVTDTGGNSALSNTLTFTLLPDTIQPVLLGVSPPNDSRRGPSSRSIRVNFLESMAPATLTAQNIRLLNSANQTFTPVDIQLRRDGKTVQLTYDTLPIGAYDIVINAAAITDRAGNPVGTSNIIPGFTIAQGTIIWTNTAGGDWSDPANWDLGRVPNASDDVFISAAPGMTITHSSGSDTVASLRSNSPFTLSGGTLTINRQAIFNNTLTLSGGNLSGAGTITSNNNVTWSNTVLEGPGIITFGLQSNVSVPAGAFPTISSRIISVSGTMSLASPLVMSGVAALNNGGTLNLIGDIGISSSGGAPTISNSGTFAKTSGSGNSTIAVPFTNRGILSASTGTLSLAGGGSSSGRMTTAAGASIGLSSSSFTFTGGANFTGAGTIRITAGTNNVNAAISVPNLAVEGGTLASPAHASVKITGNLTWTGGTIGTGVTINIAISGAAAISGNAPKTLTSATIINSGAVTWSGNGPITSSAATIQNFGGFNIQNDLVWNDGGGVPSVFNNRGALVTGGTGQTTLAIPFNNTGIVSTFAGNLSLSAGGSATGNAEYNPSGGTISLGGVHTINNGVALRGNFPVRVLGTATFNGEVSASYVALEGGVIDGPGTLTILSSFNWTAGTMAGSGLTRILPGAAFNISGDAAKILNTRTITNEGTGTWSGNGIISTENGPTFNNAGTFAVTNDLTYSGGATSTFNNTGSLSKSNSAGNTTFAVTFLNSGTATASSGTLRFNTGGAATGTFAADASANITFLTTPYALNGTTFSGDGTAHLTNTVLTVTNTVSAGNFSLEGGNIDGPGTFTVNHALNWSGGSFMGAGTTRIADGATFNITGSAGKGIDHRVIINEGAVFWSGAGGVFTRNGSSFNSFGSFTIQNDSTWNNNLGEISIFNNLGTLTKQIATGISSFGVTFNNSGNLSAETGTIGLASGGNSSGEFNATGAGTINFAGGAHILAEGSSLSGNGTIAVSSGAVNFDGPDNFLGTLSVSGGTASFKRPTTLTNLNLSGGTFGGAGAVHVKGAMSWSGLSTLDGTAAGVGSFTIDLGATLLISGTATKTLNRYNFVNAGNATWLGTGGIGQTNGNQSSFTNSGILTLGSPTGLANIAVNFIQTANATLNIRIASTSVFDTLNITGSATLAGKVNVDLLGEFVPASGNLFQILSATSITGTFASVTGEGLFTAVPNSNNVTLLAS